MQLAIAQEQGKIIQFQFYKLEQLKNLISSNVISRIKFNEWPAAPTLLVNVSNNNNNNNNNKFYL